MDTQRTIKVNKIMLKTVISMNITSYILMKLLSTIMIIKQICTIIFKNMMMNNSQTFFN